jgi:ribose/xylose/arabinose/galactoside ABC-type transport system permease subunit
MGATTLAAATALGIYQHGGFGPAHGLAILTLVALAIGSIASWSSAFGRISPVVQTVSLSATLLFHAIPAVTESLTRLPPSYPLLASAEAPQLKPIYGLLLLVFVIGLTLQLRHLGRKREA